VPDAPAQPPLPVDAVLPDLVTALAGAGRAVLQAPPGAGKTTRVPLALLEAGLTEGRIVMLEPRRLAARAAAERMAGTLGETVGGRVGYRMRGETRAGKGTRIEVVTEGVLTRMLHADPGLEGVGAILFDEFHERSLNADLGLALALEVRAALREDLILLPMSATLDAAPVAALMDDAPVITAEGRAFDVEIVHLDAPRPKAARLEDGMAELIARALEESDGSVLAFLPGEAEIRRTAARLGAPPRDVDIRPLYGALPFADQRAAVAPPSAGRRKVVLATAIAETSLTIEGVTAVVDAGLARRARFDPRSGMSRLVTERASRAEATQRAGRAGRLAPGRCYRLWTKGEEGAMPAFAPPEIEVADLAPLALDLALWGDPEGAFLPFLTPPPAGALAEARALLAGLGALDAGGRIADHGREIAALPLHPRLAHMLLHAGREAAPLAALLADRDPLRGAPVDAAHRLRALVGDRDVPGTPVPAALDRIRAEAARLARLVPAAGEAGSGARGGAGPRPRPDGAGGRTRGDGATGSGARADGTRAGGASAGGANGGGASAGGATGGGATGGGASAGGASAGGASAGGATGGGASAGGATGDGASAGGATGDGASAGGATGGRASAGGARGGAASADGAGRRGGGGNDEGHGGGPASGRASGPASGDDAGGRPRREARFSGRGREGDAAGQRSARGQAERARAGGPDGDRGIGSGAQEVAQRAAAPLPFSPAEAAALAYPDRVGLRRPGEAPRWLLSGGKGATMDADDPLAGQRLLVAIDLDGDAREARIRMALPLAEAELRAVHGDRIGWVELAEWSRRERRVVARRQERFGALVLDDRHWRDAPPDLLARAALDGVRDLGLPWSDAARRLQSRTERYRAELPPEGRDAMADLSDAALAAELEDWLLPFLPGCRTADDLRALDLVPALEARLGPAALRRLDVEMPAAFPTPLGRRLPIDYAGEAPAIAARVQEFFGVTEHPFIGPARRPLQITLLSPAGRPVQVTTDLPGFWAGSYAEVARDMRARYPKHPWPDDPTAADPTLRTKRRRG
jgi:HrpA-like RNA helicase